MATKQRVVFRLVTAVIHSQPSPVIHATPDRVDELVAILRGLGFTDIRVDNVPIAEH